MAACVVAGDCLLGEKSDYEYLMGVICILRVEGDTEAIARGIPTQPEGYHIE